MSGRYSVELGDPAGQSTLYRTDDLVAATAFMLQARSRYAGWCVFLTDGEREDGRLDEDAEADALEAVRANAIAVLADRLADRNHDVAVKHAEVRCARCGGWATHDDDGELGGPLASLPDCPAVDPDGEAAQ